MISDKLQSVEKVVIKKIESNGYVSEDEIVDVCIDNDLDLTEIDVVCGRLITRGIIIRDANDVSSGDNFVDRSQIDYDKLLDKVAYESPLMTNLINDIKNIKPPQPREWQTLITSAQYGNEFAIERIVLMYLRTVLNIAYNFSSSHNCDLEEAFQYGVMGLLKAIEKFDVTSADSFGWYFPMWCRQNMWRFCNIENTIYYFPAHYKEKLYQMIALIEEYRESDNETVEELLKFVNDEELLELVSNTNELNEMLLNLLPALELSEDIQAEKDIDKHIGEIYRHQVILDLLEILKDREREVINLRYGLNNGKIMTLEEVGAVYNLTRERIRQIEIKSLDKMRNHLHSMKIHSLHEII